MTTLGTLTEVFRMVFDDPEIGLATQMTADDIDGWDSLSHVNLIMAVENRFVIRFNHREVVGFRNVGDLARCVESKLGK